MDRFVIEFAPDAKQRDLESFRAMVSSLAFVEDVRELKDAPDEEPRAKTRPKTTLRGKLRVEERSKLYLVTPAGIAITALGRQQASVFRVLMQARGVYKGTETLYEALLLEDPMLWRGRRGQLTSVMSKLRSKLKGTAWPLTSKRGHYGFKARERRVISVALGIE